MGDPNTLICKKEECDKQSSRTMRINAEDEACARELLVLGNRTSVNDTSSSRNYKVPANIKNNSKMKHHHKIPSNQSIAIILDDQDIALNGHGEVDDTFTFIDVNDNPGLSLEPTLNSVILTSSTSGSATTNSSVSDSKRVIIHVSNASSSSAPIMSTTSTSAGSFCPNLDGNLTDAESSDDEVENTKKKDTVPKTTTDNPSGDVSALENPPSSLSMPSLSITTSKPSTESSSSTSSRPHDDLQEGNLLDLSAPKLSDTSTEENQPIDYTKKTLSSSNSSSSSSLVSPTSTSSRSSSRKPSGFCVENLIARSPPRQPSITSSNDPAASTTPYHPEIEDDRPTLAQPAVAPKPIDISVQPLSVISDNKVEEQSQQNVSNCSSNSKSCDESSSAEPNHEQTSKPETSDDNATEADSSAANVEDVAEKEVPKINDQQTQQEAKDDKISEPSEQITVPKETAVEDKVTSVPSLPTTEVSADPKIDSETATDKPNSSVGEDIADAITADIVETAPPTEASEKVTENLSEPLKVAEQPVVSETKEPVPESDNEELQSTIADNTTAVPDTVPVETTPETVHQAPVVTSEKVPEKPTEPLASLSKEPAVSESKPDVFEKITENLSEQPPAESIISESKLEASEEVKEKPSEQQTEPIISDSKPEVSEKPTEHLAAPAEEPVVSESKPEVSEKVSEGSSVQLAEPIISESNTDVPPKVSENPTEPVKSPTEEPVISESRPEISEKVSEKPSELPKASEEPIISESKPDVSEKVSDKPSEHLAEPIVFESKPEAQVDLRTNIEDESVQKSSTLDKDDLPKDSTETNVGNLCASIAEENKTDIGKDVSTDEQLDQKVQPDGKSQDLEDQNLTKETPVAQKESSQDSNNQDDQESTSQEPSAEESIISQEQVAPELVGPKSVNQEPNDQEILKVEPKIQEAEDTVALASNKAIDSEQKDESQETSEKAQDVSEAQETSLATDENVIEPGKPKPDETDVSKLPSVDQSEVPQTKDVSQHSEKQEDVKELIEQEKQPESVPEDDNKAKTSENELIASLEKSESTEIVSMRAQDEVPEQPQTQEASPTMPDAGDSVKDIKLGKDENPPKSDAVELEQPDFVFEKKIDEVIEAPQVSNIVQETERQEENLQTSQEKVQSDDLQAKSIPQAPQQFTTVATKSKPLEESCNELEKDNTQPIANSSCDNNVSSDEPESTIIPMPSTLSLVTEGDSQSSLMFSIPSSTTEEQRIVAAPVVQTMIDPPAPMLSTSDEVPAMDDFEEEITGKEIRPTISSTKVEQPPAVAVLSVNAPGPEAGNSDIKSEPVSGPPYTCQYCSKVYDNKRKYEIHVRFHTGETPFKCHLCGKGFRDDRKLKLHLQRHAGTLPNKCHLCPRSFEGPKALQKHLLAHESDRVVQPKLIQNADGSTSIALPTDNGIGGHGSTTDVVGVTPSSDATPVTEEDQNATISLSMDDLMQYAQPVPDNVITEENGLEDKLGGGSEAKFVTLNMDEFIQQGQPQPPQPIATKVPDISGDLQNDSGEFPDLLDSESNLESLSSFAASRPSKPVHEDQESGLTFATLSGVKPVYPETLGTSKDTAQEATAPPVVARKSSAPAAPKLVVNPPIALPTQPVLPSEVASSLSEAGSSAPTVTDLKTEDLNEAINQLTKSQIKLPPGTCLVPADAKCEPVVATDQAQLEMIGNALQNSNFNLGTGGQNPAQNPMIITIQYKVFPDAQGGEETKVAVQRNLADIINEAPPESSTPAPEAMPSSSLPSTPVATPTPPIQNKSTTKVKPIGVDMDTSEMPAIPVAPQPGPDPAKETRKVMSASGKEFDVPTIVTSGYDLDKLLCTFCNKVFKNDKTLMSHMLHHFGVTPKMASCPICGLTLQKKSYARHLRLHGNVVPEICPYCQKEFREKRSMDKHIKAIHQAERPYICPIPDCAETFRNQVELKNHHNRHIKDYPYECDRCPMTFQKQDSLTTHYRSHTGEKPFVCEICDKSFTSEKNKKVHVQRHQGSLPHKCEVCGMTFQSRSHLIKHATSHNRSGRAAVATPTPIVTATATPSSNKINNFLESFTASLGDDMLGGMDDNYAAETITGDVKIQDDHSVRLSLDESLEAAAAEAAITFGQTDIPEDLLRTEAQPQTQMFTIAGSGTTAIAAIGQASVDDANSLQCGICLTRFKDKRAYLIHMRKHEGKNSLKCEFCGMILQGQQNFNKHIRTNHNMDPNTVQPIVVEEDDLAENDESSQSSESFRQSGRGSVASNFEQHNIGVSASDSQVKCALCPQTFASHELLKKHTVTHFDANFDADEILREKLLKQTMRSKKKKKKNKGNKLATTQEPGAPAVKQKFKKSYSCLLCDSEFIKKASWRIHKIRHNGKGWKCRFCSELHETSDVLREHLTTIHNTSSEDIEMLGILKNANMFVVTKKLKTKKSADSDSEESDSDSDDGDDDGDDEEVDFDDDEEDELDEATSTPTSASTPTPSISISAATTISHPVLTSEVLTPVNHLQASSPTPSTSSGSGLPSLKFIEDESLFDLDALTCHACNKSFKNTRAFKLHRDRHQGALKHKCPECIKTFNGRSEVNRHMVAIHGRPLRTDEDTLHKKAETMQAQLKATKGTTSPMPGAVMTQGMAKPIVAHTSTIELPLVTTQSTIFASPLETITPTTSTIPVTALPMTPLPVSALPVSDASSSDFDALASTINMTSAGLILTSTPSVSLVDDKPIPVSMPSITTSLPVAPIPMEQLPIEPIPMQQQLPVEPLPVVEQPLIEQPPVEQGVPVEVPMPVETKPIEQQEIENPVPEGMILDMPSLMDPEPTPPPLKAPTVESIPATQVIPEPQAIVNSPKPQTEEISEEDKLFDALRSSIISDVKSNETKEEAVKEVKNVDIDEEEDNTTRESIVYSPVPPESPMSPAQASSSETEKEPPKTSDTTSMPDVEPEPHQPEPKSESPVPEERKSRRIRDLPSPTITEPEKIESDSKHKDAKVLEEIHEDQKKEPEAAENAEDLDTSVDEQLPTRRRGRSSNMGTSPSANSVKPRKTRGTSGGGSNERSPVKSPSDDSPKKKRGRPKRSAVPEASTSEDSSQEKEKENSANSKESVSQDNKDNQKKKVLKQKGVTVNKEGKVLIPSHKITLPEELCQIVEGKKGKKMYQCQICSKEFNRKDIINYHVYNEHREEFLEYGKGLPEVLTREESDGSPTKPKPNNAAAAIFKKIFTPKMKSGNNDVRRKGQVEIEIKSKKSNSEEDEDERRLGTKRSEPEPEARTSSSRNEKAKEDGPSKKLPKDPEIKKTKEQDIDKVEKKSLPKDEKKESNPIDADSDKTELAPEVTETPALRSPRRELRGTAKSEPKSDESEPPKEEIISKPEPVAEAQEQEEAEIIPPKTPGRRGRKPKLPKKIQISDEDQSDTVGQKSPVAEKEEPSIGKRTRGSSRKSESESETPKKSPPPQLEEVVQPKEEPAAKMIAPVKVETPKKSKAEKSPIVLIEKTPPHEVDRLTSPTRESPATIAKSANSKDDEPSLSSSRRRRRSAKQEAEIEDVPEPEASRPKSSRGRKTEIPEVVEKEVVEKEPVEPEPIAETPIPEKVPKKRGRKKATEKIEVSTVDEKPSEEAVPETESVCKDVKESEQKQEEEEKVVKRRGRKKAVEKPVEEPLGVSKEQNDDVKEASTLATEDKPEVEPTAEAPPKVPEEKVIKKRGRKKASEIALELSAAAALKEKSLRGKKPEGQDEAPKAENPITEVEDESPKEDAVRTRSPRKATLPSPTKESQPDPKTIKEPASDKPKLPEPEKITDEKDDIPLKEMNKVEDKDEQHQEEDILETIRGKKGKVARKILKLSKDIDDLIEYQEQQSRFRNRTLLDCKGAWKILKKYRYKPPKCYQSTQVEKGLTLRISRQHRKPYHAIEKVGGNPLKLKLIKRPPDIEHVSEEQIIENEEPIQAALIIETTTTAPPTIPKKRGRPARKAIESVSTLSPIKETVTENVKPEVKVEDSEDQPIKSPSPKRRMLSPSIERPVVKDKEDPAVIPSTSSSSMKADASVQDPNSLIQQQQHKRRGRPPKKAIIAEFEAAESAKLLEQKDQNEPKFEVTIENIVPVAEAAIPPIPATSQIPEMAKPETKEQPDRPRKRGRPPKKAIPSEAGETIDESELEDIPLKRRALREKKIPAADEATKSDDPVDVMKVSIENNPLKENVESIAEKEEDGKATEPKTESHEVNDNQYTIQHSSNPLKFKLKTGKEHFAGASSPEPTNPKVPLKLKLSLKSSAGDEEFVKKKKKKKKHKEKTSDGEIGSADKPQIILKIKSPTRGSNTGGGNNGFLMTNEQSNSSATAASLASPSEEPNRAASSASGKSVQGGVSFSPESSPEHESQSLALSSQFLAKEGSHHEIGLGEGQFNDLMKAIDSDDESKPSDASKVAPKVWPITSVKQSQVDGTIDSWSRSSSISQDSPIHLMEDENDDVEAQGAIHKRMKQIQQNKPKTKSCLIKHVFSAVAKKRKIVVVRYRKPEERIYDLEEYFDRQREGRLDEPYDEDTDDPTMKSKGSSKAVVQTTSEVASATIVADDEYWREDPGCLASLESLVCHYCQRNLPNKLRMHAHLQMHKDTILSQSRKSYDEDRIDQLDGETDLMFDDEDGTSYPSTSGLTAVPTTATTTGTTGNQTQLYILKGQDTCKVYQCPQCPEVFPGQKALLTHQSLVHHDSLTNTIFPCQHCSIGFRDANSLELHVRNEHGKQQIVTIIQADLQRETGSTGSSFGSSSSSCSSSTTSSHPSSSSSGHFSMQSESASNGESSSSHHPLLMKQDPVLMFNSDEEQDLMLDESLNLFETSSLIDSGDSAIHLSLDDLANFAQPIVATDGSHTSFDTSIETSSFLSGTDALDIINDSNTQTPIHVEPHNRLGNGNSNGGSRTPSISDDGEFPCTQCEKRFGNRRNLLSHMRRHTGDFKLFCDHCSKGFFTQSKLESHKRKHTGEKPFRCLLKTCLKRFRYKGDLSKHIKKYHPGHTQELTPVPPQEDELLNMQNQPSSGQSTSTLRPSSAPTLVSSQSGTTTTTIVVSQTGNQAGSNTTSGNDNKFFLPLLPRHPVQQEELMASGFSKDLVNDTDPTLDDNILDLLADDDSPMLSLSPGPSLPPPPPPPPPRPQNVPSSSTATIVSSKLHEVLTQGRPKPTATNPTEAFVVPSTSFKPMNTNKTTHIVNLAGNTYKTLGNNKPLAISISQVFACAQPLPLQEDAKHQSKGKMTTIADLDARSASSVLSANAAFVQGLVNAKKTGATIIATSGSGGNIFRTTGGQQVSIIRSAGSNPSNLNPGSGGIATIVNKPTKAFVCDFKGCNKSFEKASFLKRHAKLHSSNCKFVCDVCTKCFESQSKLDDHYRKHTGAKPFICHICGNAFRYKGDRTKHLKNIHGVLKTSTATSASATIVSSAISGSASTDGSGNGTSNHRASPFILEDTSSSISSFQSTSDQSSLAGSLVESPTKTEPLEHFVNQREASSNLLGTLPNSTETVTMTLEEISQFAQNIY